MSSMLALGKQVGGQTLLELLELLAVLRILLRLPYLQPS